MKVPRWLGGRGGPEKRSSSFEGRVTDAIVAAATGERETADGLAALEFCAGLVSRCFATAEVSNDRYSLVTPAVLELIGRELVIRGESVHLIEAGMTRPRLVPAGTWDVRGDDDPMGWRYRVDLFGASQHRTRLVPGAAVVHARVNTDPVRPWIGRAAHRIAATTSSTAALAETGAQKELKTPHGRLLASPGTAVQRGEVATEVAKGGLRIMPSGRDIDIRHRQDNSSSQWRPAYLGPEVDDGARSLRAEAAQAVILACGVPLPLADPRTDGTSRREAYRTFIFTLLSPWARTLEAELRDKLDSPSLSLSFAGLHGADLGTRGRALKQLVDAGVSLSEALAITGLEEANAS